MLVKESLFTMLPSVPKRHHSFQKLNNFHATSFCYMLCACLSYTSASSPFITIVFVVVASLAGNHVLYYRHRQSFISWQYKAVSTMRVIVSLPQKKYLNVNLKFIFKIFVHIESG